MGQIVPFPELTPEEALARIRELGARSGAVGLSGHARKRMAQRRASWQQIQQALGRGVPVEGPYQDLLGDWICRLSVRAVGRNVEVVVRTVACRRLVIRTIIT